MNRLVTRGMGPSHLLITRGLGTSGIVVYLKKVVRLCSCIGRELNLVSKWKINCA